MRNIGDFDTILVNGKPTPAVISCITKIRLDDEKEIVLEKYTIENYGETNDYISQEDTNATHEVYRRGRSMMPPEFVYKFGKDINWRIYGEDTTVIKKILNNYIAHFFDYQKSGNGLYVYSKTKGSGKTMISCALANEIIKRYDISFKFTNIPDYLEFVTGKSEQDKETVRAIRECTLLVLDDIGIEPKKDWVQEVIYSLVNFRYTRHLPTIYTSNCKIYDLPVDSRISDRINAMSGTMVYVPEKDIRRMKAEAESKKYIEKIIESNEEMVIDEWK